MCVGVCVCVYVCRCVGVYVCMCACVYVCMYVRVSMKTEAFLGGTGKSCSKTGVSDRFDTQSLSRRAYRYIGARSEI